MTRQRTDSVYRYLQAKVPKELHRRVVSAALDEERDVKDLVAEAVEAYLELHHRLHRSPKETPTP